MNLIKVMMLAAFSCFAFACASTTQNTAVSTNVAAPPANTAKPANAAATPAEVASGRKIYTDNCAACHKESGTGGPIVIEGKKLKPDDLTTEKRKAYSDDKIAGIVKQGIEDEGMPAYEDKLNDAQIAELIKYIRTDIQKQ